MPEEKQAAHGFSRISPRLFPARLSTRLESPGHAPGGPPRPQARPGRRRAGPHRVKPAFEGDNFGTAGQLVGR
jgi:hypothetical protein